MIKSSSLYFLFIKKMYIYTNVHMQLNIWTYLRKKRTIYKIYTNYYFFFENKETYENRTNKQTNK